MLRFFATAPRATEDLLANELVALGAREVHLARNGVRFEGTLDIGYRACFFSRIASRVLLPLAELSASSAEALYEGARAVAWADHLGPDDTFAVDASGTSAALRNETFAAMKIKDAVVDSLRERFGRRPSVDTESPSVRLNLRVERERAVLSLDLSGESLHKRGYRARGVAAPLKENLAAAMLLRSGWPQVAQDGGAFVDPMCGSGTLPIEAALLAADIAPGLLRQAFAAARWRGHEPALLRDIVAEAEARRDAGLAKLPPIFGYDDNPAAIESARHNARGAGLDGRITLQVRPLRKLTRPDAERGMVVTNPPYGERLADKERLAPLYTELGKILKERFVGYSAHVLTSDDGLAAATGLRAHKKHALWNGPIACHLWHFALQGPRPVRERVRSPGAEMLANRLHKNLRILGKWAAREGIGCYRLYDADIPEYAVAVDVYEDAAHIQEYAPPRSVDEAAARERFRDVLHVVPEVLGVPRERVFAKVRKRQKGGTQYERHGEGTLRLVHESGHAFWVDLESYLDTGLFLDHRMTRQHVGSLAAGKRFLNLYSYTGTATVYAAKGGARSTTSVDLSKTYLAWTQKNFDANGIRGREHELVHADCMRYLRETSRVFDLVFVDPPTFSRSKRMEGTFDVQRDHVELLELCGARLAKGGVIVFSNNFRRFEIDSRALSTFDIVDITARTIPKDFARNPRIHQCFELRRR